MRYFSMFSGIGGFELGINQAYGANISIRNGQAEVAQGNTPKQSVEPATESDGHRRGISDNISGGDTRTLLDTGQPKCVGYSEIDKYAVQIYSKHFPTHKNYGDCTTINPAELPDLDFLCGGFPCQAFSIAGLRRGFEDTRGTLFFQIARILAAKRPSLLLLENVKGLLSHDKGRTFERIVQTLDELGYDLQWQVLNSKNFGVPQNRERVFIIGHLRGTRRPQVFPFGDYGQKANELQGHVANTLTRRYEGAQATGTYIGEGELNAQIGTLRTHKDGNGFREVKSGLAPTIPARAREDGGGQPVIAIDTKQVGTPRFTQNVATLGANDYKEPKKVMEGTKIRRLTPVECERLQGFPDGWTEGVSDTQRYKCLGNAVTVNVVREIIKKLYA